MCGQEETSLVQVDRLRIREQRDWDKGCGLIHGFCDRLKVRTPHRPGAMMGSCTLPSQRVVSNAGGLDRSDAGKNLETIRQEVKPFVARTNAVVQLELLIIRATKQVDPAVLPDAREG